VLLSLGAAAAQTADELLAQFRYPEAAVAADAAVKRLEQAGSTDTLEYAKALDMQAKAREKAGTPFAETSKLLNRAIELKTRLAGLDDLPVAESLNILGAQSYTARDYKGAAAALERARSIEQAHSGASVIDVTDTLIGLGRVLSIQQQRARALELHQEALGMMEKEFGPEHRRTADAGDV
jgi:tetratricopeptide (TPR) repeat protein